MRLQRCNSWEDGSDWISSSPRSPARLAKCKHSWVNRLAGFRWEGEESSVDEYKWWNYVRRSRAEVEGFGRSLESASWVPKRCWVSRRPPGRIRNGIPLEVQ